MKVKEFEAAILDKAAKLDRGLKPKEVRLEHNHVKWFLCEGDKFNEIVVFNKDGKAFALSFYKWPEEVENIRLESKGDNITIDGRLAYDAGYLDLEFKKNAVPGLYVEETVCPYPERDTCDGCPRYDENEDICDLENPDF